MVPGAASPIGSNVDMENSLTIRSDKPHIAVPLILEIDQWHADQSVSHRLILRVENPSFQSSQLCFRVTATRQFRIGLLLVPKVCLGTSGDIFFAAHTLNAAAFR